MTPKPNPKSKNQQYTEYTRARIAKRKKQTDKLRISGDEEELRQINKQIAVCWKYKELALHNGDFANYHYFDDKLKEAFNKKRRCTR